MPLSAAAPPNELFIVSAFIGFILSFIPFHWHLRAANVGTCLFMLWVGLCNLNRAVNAIIWNHNVINSAPVWCDISTRIEVAGYMGVPASLFVILRRLYKIASVTGAARAPGERRREIILDLATGLGLPILHSTLEVVINADRFNIWEGYGCLAQPWPTWLTWLIYYPWPFVVTVISSIYGALAYQHLRRHALQAQEFESSNSRVNSGRYQRLLGMTTIVLTLSFSLGIFVLWSFAQSPLQPEITWAAIHADYNNVQTIPRVLMAPEQIASFETERWLPVATAFIFFAFFGFADEAKTNYRKVYATITHAAGLRSGSSVASTRSPLGITTFTGTLSFVDQNKALTRRTSLVYSPTIPSLYTPSVASTNRQKRGTVYSFIDTLSLAPSEEHRPSSPCESSPSLLYPPGLGPSERAAGHQGYESQEGRRSLHIEAAPRHEFDGPHSARPYSTWSDAV